MGGAKVSERATVKGERSEVCDCGHAPAAPPACGMGPVGYGTTDDGKTVCYACCAERDRATMAREGNSRKLPLYLTRDNAGRWSVANWPGSLRFEAREVRTCKVNGYGRMQRRTYARFTGPDGMEWWGFQQGEWNEVFHAWRKREKVRRGEVAS